MRSLFVFVCAIAIPVAVGAQSSPARDTTALRREVDALNHSMETAFARGDMKAVAALFADNGVIRSAHGVGAAGRAEIDAYFARIPNPKSWKLEVFDVTDQGGLVYQTGMTTAVFGSPEKTNRFQFLFVWQREKGTMRILLNYYHVPEP